MYWFYLLTRKEETFKVKIYRKWKHKIFLQNKLILDHTTMHKRLACYEKLKCKGLLLLFWKIFLVLI